MESSHADELEYIFPGAPDAHIRLVPGGPNTPRRFGRPAVTVWPEIWHEVGPRAEFAMHRNEGTYDEALPFILRRKAHPEETYVTFSYSPIPDDRGGCGGGHFRRPLFRQCRA